MVFKTPKYLKDLVSVLPAARDSLRRNTNGVLLCSSHIKTKKTMGDGPFMVVASTLVKHLPQFIRALKTTKSFKCALKHFFTEAYGM